MAADAQHKAALRPFDECIRDARIDPIARAVLAKASGLTDALDATLRCERVDAAFETLRRHLHHHLDRGDDLDRDDDHRHELLQRIEAMRDDAVRWLSERAEAAA